MLYNCVPHALVLVYVRFGDGRVLRNACAVCATAQGAISVLALILLWILYPREADYVKAVGLSLRALFAEWSGDIPEPFPVAWRDTSGLHNILQINITRIDPLTGAVLPEPERHIDLSGGFYTEGEIGPVKVTTHIAWSTALLAWSLLEFPEWWARDAARWDASLQLVQHGLEYVLACYVPAKPLPGWPQGREPPAADEDQIVYVVRSTCLMPQCF